MKLAQAVIGSNYGDEGKGLITDYLVNRENAKIVVRANGGAQSGHTVVTPDGNRHTFGHFGSGTFQGVQTYLSRHFVLNPMLFWKEKKALDEMHIYYPKLMVDPRAIITTPWDIIANQARERTNPRGSCGVGFMDTINRNEYSEDRFRFTIGEASFDLGYHHGEIQKKLNLIRTEWLPERLKEWKVPITDELKALYMSEEVFQNYLHELETFVFSVSLIETKDLGFYAHDGIVFENSQGLGLDWNRGTRPYVTRSNTGLANIIDVCEEAKIAAVEVYYTTRCYLTRHGMGPMENERDKPFKNAVELSNKENEFQGKFRMGQLNVSKVRERIKTDLESFDSKVKVFPNLAITCLDQADDLSKYRVGGTVVSVKRENLAASIAREVGMPCFLESWGPTRDTVKEGFAL